MDYSTTTHIDNKISFINSILQHISVTNEYSASGTSGVTLF